MQSNQCILLRNSSKPFMVINMLLNPSFRHLGHVSFPAFNHVLVHFWQPIIDSQQLVIDIGGCDVSLQKTHWKHSSTSWSREFWTAFTMKVCWLNWLKWLLKSASIFSSNDLNSPGSTCFTPSNIELFTMSAISWSFSSNRNFNIKIQSITGNFIT